MNKKQAWLELCIKHNPKLYGNDAKIALNYYLLGKGIIQHVEKESLTDHCLEFYGLDNRCMCCGKPIKKAEDAETGTGYWSKESWWKYHKDCKYIKRQREIEQQKIDCGCNYCKYLERTGHEQGYCTKLDKKVVAVSNYCQFGENNKCFKHRSEE
jgi:hypothetical protein